MVYRKENGVIVPYANNSGQNVAADISIIDKNGKVVSAGGTTNIQALVSKISDDTVELSSDLASKQIKKTKLSSVAFNNGAGMAYFDWTNKILVSAYEDSGSNAITVTPYNRGNTTTVGFGALVYGLSAFTGTTDIILCYQDIA